MKNIVSAEYLYQNRGKVVLIDATNNFMIPEEGKAKYEKRHIEGAFHIDLKEDMSREITVHGGRDPLPEDMNSFKEKLESFGISTDTEIIVYDEDIVPASRFWWMAKYIGLKNVKVLDGGINAWLNSGYSLTDKIPEMPLKGHIEMSLQDAMIVDISDIRSAIKDKNTLIIDSRSPVRYRGEDEPIDVKAGHMPSAKNYFYENVLEQDGTYKSLEVLKAQFKNVNSPVVICHCGSGVSGPVNIIALDELGIKAKLYVGSWSDYITYEDSVIEVGE